MNPPTTPTNQIDSKLFFWSGLATLILTVSAIINISSASGLISLLLFFPIVIYFLYQAAFRLLVATQRFLNSYLPPHRYFGKFYILLFTKQAEADFLITLVLYAAAVSAIMFRTSWELLR